MFSQACLFRLSWPRTPPACPLCPKTLLTVAEEGEEEERERKKDEVMEMMKRRCKPQVTFVKLELIVFFCVFCLVLRFEFRMIALWWLLLALCVSCLILKIGIKKKLFLLNLCGRNFHKYSLVSLFFLTKITLSIILCFVK